MFLVVAPSVWLMRVQYLGSRAAAGDWPREASVYGAHFEAGGPGLVAARTLRDLGSEIRILAAAGGRTGELLRESLEDEGLDAELVSSSSLTPMASRIHEPSRPEVLPRNLWEPAMPLETATMRRMLEHFDELAPRLDAVLLFGEPVGRSSSFLHAELVRRARTAHVRCLLASQGSAADEAIPQGPESILLSQRAHELALAENGRTKEDFAERCFAAGTRTIVATQDSKDVVVRTPDAEARIQVPKTGDRAGFGAREALGAAWLHAQVDGWDLLPAIFFGVGAGTARIRKRLGGRLQRSEVEAFQRQVRLRDPADRVKPR